MKNNIPLSYFIGLFLLAIFTFSSCEKDDLVPNEGEPEDIMIPIDENSAFNMKNFIASFEQLFNARDRWAWNFSHDYTAGKAITSFQNYKILGSFGDKYFTITHNYNNDGIVVSSERVGSIAAFAPITFIYEFDKKGFITKLTKKEANKTKDIVDLEYNEGNRLIKKTHIAIKSDSEERYETFTYNSDASVASYGNEDGEKEEYSYVNGNMVETKYYEGETPTAVDKWEYDENARLIKMYRVDATSYFAVEYCSEFATYLGYDNDLLVRKEEYISGVVCLKQYSYNYDDGEFEYCIMNELDENSETKKKYYYQGTISDLQLVGYSAIEARDDPSREKLKESIYNTADLKLYYVEFTLADGAIAETNWFQANGSPIAESEINESWVIDLVNN